MAGNEAKPVGTEEQMPAWLERLAATPIEAQRDTGPVSAAALARQLGSREDPADSDPVPQGLWSLPGFGPMLRIATSFGPVPAQALRKRDLVRTRTGEFRKIEWVDRMVLDEGFLKSVPSALPVLIRAGALGPSLPASDMVVSPEQVICVAAPGAPPRRVAARDLLSRPGVMRKPEQIFTYTRFHCGEPVEVQAEGMWLQANPPGIA
jgi:hypothetical protein